MSYSLNPDNETGNPIFEPELTGRNLGPKAMMDWIAFCTKVQTLEEGLYSTWFENRYARKNGWPRDKASVYATEAKNGAIIINCPSRLWAEKLLDHMGSLRGLFPKRNFIVVAPGYVDNLGGVEEVRQAILSCQEMQRADNSDKPLALGHSSWAALERMGATMLDRIAEGR